MTRSLGVRVTHNIFNILKAWKPYGREYNIWADYGVK